MRQVQFHARCGLLVDVMDMRKTALSIQFPTLRLPCAKGTSCPRSAKINTRNFTSTILRDTRFFFFFIERFRCLHPPNIFPRLQPGSRPIFQFLNVNQGHILYAITISTLIPNPSTSLYPPKHSFLLVPEKKSNRGSATSSRLESNTYSSAMHTRHSQEKWNIPIRRDVRRILTQINGALDEPEDVGAIDAPGGQARHVRQAGGPLLRLALERLVLPLELRVDLGPDRRYPTGQPHRRLLAALRDTWCQQRCIVILPGAH